MGDQPCNWSKGSAGLLARIHTFSGEMAFPDKGGFYDNLQQASNHDWPFHDML